MKKDIYKIFKDKHLILGTAQIMNNYGITNNTKKNLEQAIDVLKEAEKLGIFTYDTSPKYLGAHNVLENFIKNNYNNYTIIEKLSCENIKVFNKEKKAIHWPWLNKFILKGGNICLMLHNGQDYLKKSCRKDLQGCKEQGLVNFIGISVYDPEILKKCLEFGGFDIVQYPLSIADRRFYDSILLKKIKAQNIIMNIRSIFLQGLLLKKPIKKFSFFNNFKEIYLEYEKLFPSIEKKILLAMRSVLEDIKGSIVVGVENKAQLNTIDKMLKLKKTKKLMIDIYKSRKLWSNLPENAIDPRKW